MTVDELKSAVFRGPIRFLDGRKGMAQQDFECITEPRFGYSWRRESRSDKGRQFYTVDGQEVESIDAAALLLAIPPNPESPREQFRADINEIKASPKLSGATRALSEARCNADAGPFAGIRAWMRRSSDPWHHGINNYADAQRRSGASWDDYRWMYDAKSAAHETYRLMYLFEADRQKDTGLKCAIGVRCRDCSILNTIETAMIADRQRERFPREIEDSDIDAAKVWTCIAHILSAGANPMDGVFVASKRDREDAADDAARWAAVEEGDPG